MEPRLLVEAFFALFTAYRVPEQREGTGDGTACVPAGQYLVLGDNRAES